MKTVFAALGIVILTVACQENESTKKSDFTGNESVYALQSGSVYSVDGTVTFKERLDGTAEVVVALSGTDGEVLHPVHLHLGDIATDGASVAALLNPVVGKTGKSETLLTILADESPITYKQLTKLNACVKIHLSDSGPDQNIVLAGGNIGEAAANNLSNGRLGVAVCKSE